MSHIPKNNRSGLPETHTGAMPTTSEPSHPTYAETSSAISTPSVSSVGQITDRTSVAHSRDKDHISTLTTPTTSSISTRYDRASSVISNPSIGTEITELANHDRSVLSMTHQVDTETSSSNRMGNEKRSDTIERLQHMGFDVLQYPSDARKAILQCVKDGDVNAAAFLSEDQAVLGARDEEGKTPLYLAVESGIVAMVQLILKYDNDHIYSSKIKSLHQSVFVPHYSLKEIPDKMPRKWLLPIHVAVQHGHTDILISLIDAGANIESRTYEGLQPVHVAAKYNQVACLQALLERGVALEAGNGRHTPLHYAARHNCEAVARVLIDRGVSVEARVARMDPRPIHAAALNDEAKDVLRLLLDRGAALETRESLHGGTFTALHLSAELGHVNIVTALLIQGANIEVEAHKIDDPFYTHFATPLHFAAREGRIDVVDVLLNRGANIEAMTRQGCTPLFLAARKGLTVVMTLLLDRGADIETQKSISHSTPLIVAASYGHVEAVKLLLGRGANVSVRDSDGDTALKIAKAKGQKVVVDLLSKWGGRT